MRLAKPFVDIGLYTEDLDAHRRFWQGELGLVDEGFQKLGAGVRQHRLGLRGAVLKVNHSRVPLHDAGPSGLRRITIASEGVDATVDLAGPDNVAVRLVPVGHGGISHVGVDVAAVDAARTTSWWVDGVGGDDLGDGRVQVGATVLTIDTDTDRSPTGAMGAAGLSYLTVQVHDVVAEHQRMVGWGADSAMTPTRLGDTAVIAFVRTPDGDWLELSQRADLTGPLPDI